MVQMNETLRERMDEVKTGGRKARHAGWGMLALLGEGARGMFERLAERGAKTEEEQMRSLEGALERGRDVVSSLFARPVERVVDGMNLVTRDDLAELREQLVALNEKLEVTKAEPKPKTSKK